MSTDVSEVRAASIIRAIRPNSILSHSHTIPLSLSSILDRRPICHSHTSSPIVTHTPALFSLKAHSSPWWRQHAPLKRRSTFDRMVVQLVYERMYRMKFKDAFSLTGVRNLEKIYRHHNSGAWCCRRTIGVSQQPDQRSNSLGEFQKTD
jgi:hypothetical protein